MLTSTRLRRSLTSSFASSVALAFSVAALLVIAFACFVEYVDRNAAIRGVPNGACSLAHMSVRSTSRPTAVRACARCRHDQLRPSPVVVCCREQARDRREHGAAVMI